METQEAAENYGEPYRCPATNENEYCKHDIISAFNNGAKYQAERMYREDEVVDLIADWTKMAKGLNMNFPADKFEQWFEQFKKK